MQTADNKYGVGIEALAWLLPLIVILVAGGIMLSVSVSNANERNRCRNYMAQLAGASRSYALDNGVSFDSTISPTNLRLFITGVDDHRCPAGTNPYAPFVIKDGPKCPNSDEHNTTFNFTK